MIPATVRIGATEWTTSLFPKDGRYIIPIKPARQSVAHGRRIGAAESGPELRALRPR